MTLKGLLLQMIVSTMGRGRNRKNNKLKSLLLMGKAEVVQEDHKPNRMKVQVKVILPKLDQNQRKLQVQQ